MVRDAFEIVVAAIGRSPTSTAICCDFDGTLAPIVDDPAAATPLAGVVEALEALADRYCVVAVLSGRPVSYLLRWLPASVELHGLYGLEAVRGGSRHDHPDAVAWRRAIEQVATAGAGLLPDGVLVEDKGLSLTLHYRVQPDAADAVLAFAEQQAARTGLALRTARRSIELHPPVAVDKGTVLRGIVEGCAAACFIGDDAGDLPAFTALDELAEGGLATARVAVASAESPPELLARADLVVDGPAGVLALLEAL